LRRSITDYNGVCTRHEFETVIVEIPEEITTGYPSIPLPEVIGGEWLE
jgi:hypothetical protein